MVLTWYVHELQNIEMRKEVQQPNRKKEDGLAKRESVSECVCVCGVGWGVFFQWRETIIDRERERERAFPSQSLVIQQLMMEFAPVCQMVLFSVSSLS